MKTIARAVAVGLGATVFAACSSGSDGSTSVDAGVGDSGAPVDATTTSDGATMNDAGADVVSGDAVAQGCGELTGDAMFTCSKDGASRGKCDAGTLVQEACARGCLHKPAGQDSVCLGPAGSDTLDCNGSYGLTPATDGDYYISSFGCWVDPNNVVHTDPGDNCIPSCFAQAKTAGLCMASDTGPECEQRINWFTADGARFGCLARLKVTNPANGKAVIAVALDYGPGCSGERAVNEEVLDSSGRIDLYLFGSAQGASEHSTVHVVEVDPSTPLGPVP